METPIQVHFFSESQALDFKEKFADLCEVGQEEDWSSDSYGTSPSVYVWGETNNLESLIEAMTEYYKEQKACTFHYQEQGFTVLIEDCLGEKIITLHPIFAKDRKLSLNEWCDLLDAKQIGQMIIAGDIVRSYSGKFSYSYENKTSLLPNYKWQACYIFASLGVKNEPQNKCIPFETQSLREAEVQRIVLGNISQRDSLFLSCIEISIEGTKPDWLQKRSIVWFGMS